MGNCNNYAQDGFKDFSLWQQIQKDNYNTTYRHPQKNLIAQKWISLEIQNPSIYSWRMKNHNKNLPKIQELSQQVLPDYCHSKKNETVKGSVIITQQYFLLSKLSFYTAGQCALMIRQLLNGLKTLCQKFGWFQINDQNIFFDQNGHSFIWIHPNLAVNKPRHRYNNKQCSQQKIINTLVAIILKKLQKNQVLNLPSQGLTFKKSDAWLSNFLEKYYPKLDKVYINRAQYDLSQERKSYRKSTDKTIKNKIIQQNLTIKQRQRILTRTESTNPSEIMMGFKAKQPFYYQIPIQRSFSVQPPRQNKRIESNIQYSQQYEKQNKDPDLMLLQLIQQCKLDEQ